MRSLRKVIILASIFLQTQVHAEALYDIAQAIQNPLKINHFAKHIDLPLENDTNFDYGPRHEVQNILKFKPLLPFHFIADYDLIFRTIVPIYERTPTTKSNGDLTGGYISGWGDINPTLFITPALFDIVSWGIGPTISLPTATNNKDIGSGKISIGPELAVMAFSNDWVVGFLTYNYWSCGGDSKRPAVNQFSFQYYISYTFKDAWFFTTKPTITANWKKPGNQQWIVPFGVGLGKAFHVGTDSMSLALEGYYNAARPSGVGPNWQLQLGFDFLLPATTTMGA